MRCSKTIDIAKTITSLTNFFKKEGQKYDKNKHWDRHVKNLIKKKTIQIFVLYSH